MTAAIENMRVPAIDIVIESALWSAEPDAEAIARRALEEAASAIGANFKDHELAVLLTDDAAIRRLNAQWRGIDKATNVLSFPPAPRLAGADREKNASISLGDIAIAFETTAREAKAEDKPFDHHLAHLCVHGFLHLLGYDHESESEAETMEQLERVILRRLDVPDPYPAHENLVPADLTQEIRG